MARKPGKASAAPRRARSGGVSVVGADQQAAMAAVRRAADQLNRGEVEGAAATVQQGLRSSPKHPDLLHLGGQAALYLGDIPRGKEMIRRAIKIAPKVALYHYNLGNVLFSEGDLDGALKCFRLAVRTDPKFVDAFTNLAIVCAQKKRREEAESAFDAAVRLQPDNPQLHLNLAICRLELRKPDEVAASIAKVEELVSQPDAHLLHQIGNIYRGLGRHLVAEDYYRRSLKLEADAPGVWFALGDVLSQAGEREKALEALDRLQSLEYDPSPVKHAIARVLAGLGDVAQAKVLLAEAFEAAGDEISYITRIAELYSLLGDFEAQESCLKRVLELDPDNIDAFAGLAFKPGRGLADDKVARLRKLAEDKNVDAKTRSGIGFALGNHYHHAKRYLDAFHYYRLGNRQKGYSFDRRGYTQWVARLEELFTRDFFAERASWGSESRMPILIAGLPRSGTTLTEQVLSSHPAVFGAGEYGLVTSLAGLPSFNLSPERTAGLVADEVAESAANYLSKLQIRAQKGESFVTNKLPHNFQQLGVFGLLFPQAPIVLVQRDPRDNLLSIYFQDFAGFHDYAYDLKSLGHYYQLYRRLTEHWLRVIPNPVFSLQYEDLVADLPGKAREMADFVGLEWDERMLRFYEQEREVKTASKWQVRQPLYTSSVARWKPYEKQLRPLFELLGPLPD